MQPSGELLRDEPAPQPPEVFAATGAERLALRVLQLGAIAVVFAVSIRKEFELDRFFIPKELVLHLAACLAALLAWRGVRRIPFTRVDLLLVGWLVLGALSAAFATNPWLATRALAISVSSVLIFWTARALHDAGLARPLLRAVALGIVLVAVTSLLQTYGVRTELFSLNRAPGGTLGNRNFIAHAAAFGFPAILLVALTARHAAGMLVASLGTAILAGTLVLTRSRAAWLAFGVALLLILLAMFVSPVLRRAGRVWFRLAVVLVLVAGGVAAAILVPNTLRWRSDDPYLDTVRRVAEYEEGSGRGRLVQYGRSMRMAAAHPVLGVGPGNWGVEYPEHAARSDPSMSRSQGGMTANPWPSSDWIASIAERGFLPTLLLAIALAAIALHAWHQLRQAMTPEEGLRASAILATLAATVIAGAFDAVLLLALPSFFVWSALGAMWAPTTSFQRAGVPRARSAAFLHSTLALILILAAGAAAARSAMQVTAIEIYATREDRTSLARAARIDPGNYWLRLRLARSSSGEQRCEHALAAERMYPHADAASRLARGCD